MFFKKKVPKIENSEILKDALDLASKNLEKVMKDVGVPAEGIKKTFTFEELGIREPSICKGAKLEVEIEPKVEEKWIWVDGFKGFNKGLVSNSYKGKVFQYEVGKTYNHSSDNPIVCESGFHFSLKLEEVFSYFPLNMIAFPHQYCKVRALVREKDIYPNGLINFEDGANKYTSKSIEILEELTYDDLKEYILAAHKFVKSEEDYLKILEKGYSNFLFNILKERINNLGFTELYSKIIEDRLFDKIDSVYCKLVNSKRNEMGYRYSYSVVRTGELEEIFENTFSFIDRITALKNEEISKDMLIYFIEKEI